MQVECETFERCLFKYRMLYKIERIARHERVLHSRFIVSPSPSPRPKHSRNYHAMFFLHTILKRSGTFTIMSAFDRIRFALIRSWKRRKETDLRKVNNRSMNIGEKRYESKLRII